MARARPAALHDVTWRRGRALRREFRTLYWYPSAELAGTRRTRSAGASVTVYRFLQEACHRRQHAEVA